jgi:hypothetical protein
MKGISYKANASEVLDRLRDFVGRKANDRIFAAFIPPSAAMKSFQKKYSGFTEYPEPHGRIRFWDSMFKERTRLEDDSIPAAYPSEFDQGLYGGLLGGDVRFLAATDDGYVSSGWISSMIPPLLKDWSGFDKLKFDENHFWFKRFTTQLRIMKEAAGGKFGISHLIAIDSFNFVYELIGATETYLSVVENPDFVQKGIDFGFDLNLKIHSTFFDIVRTLEGGTCSWVVPWIPGRVVNESVDPFHMTSVEYFEKYGIEPAERFISRYDGGVLHLHANGWHLLESACGLKGLKAILMVNEKDHPPALGQIETLRKRAGEVPLSIMVNYNEFTESLERHELVGGVFYYVSAAPDIDSANRWMEKVRAYRA